MTIFTESFDNLNPAEPWFTLFLPNMTFTAQRKRDATVTMCQHLLQDVSSSFTWFIVSEKMLTTDSEPQLTCRTFFIFNKCVVTADMDVSHLHTKDCCDYKKHKYAFFSHGLFKLKAL